MAGPHPTDMEIETQFNQLTIETTLSMKNAVLVYSEDFAQIQNNMPRIAERASFVFELIKAYKLFEKLQIKQPQTITPNDLAIFHSKDYIKSILHAENESITNGDEFTLGYDCPVFDNVYSFASSAVSGTLTAVDSLLQGETMVAINWCGGWHHAQRDMASGYCYFNDIVIGIIKLHEKFRRVLYIDLDLHHGDGVQNAFYYTDKVLTVSFHKYCSGFYPGTGSVKEIGEGSGEYFSINIPFKDGLDDDTMVSVVNYILPGLYEKYRPDAVVVQCGVDGLAHDPMDSFNLTGNAYIHTINMVINWKLPLLILGGGGYDTPNTAKVWTRVTALACGVCLNEDIPDHIQFIHYGPDFTLTISPSYRTNYNLKNNYLTYLMTEIQLLIEDMGKRVENCNTVV
ncbi:Histone deacetylase 8-like [Oopsacas minuta]|uniref:Histone deacetylase n=1 Tax=Oopsacas minuta TaxID=111878 RepID=A0AAV7KER8_9METZ|nr:Histone deacetylase 8-like [Oopsacas minuta]